MWILGGKVFKAASLNIVNEPKEKNQIILKIYHHDWTDKESKEINRKYKKEPKGSSEHEKQILKFKTQYLGLTGDWKSQQREIVRIES